EAMKWLSFDWLEYQNNQVDDSMTTPDMVTECTSNEESTLNEDPPSPTVSTDLSPENIPE
ncbi:hypothetical protein U1Q18_003834, partial [Sarracenia purpurea var. burkii]